MQHTDNAPSSGANDVLAFAHHLHQGLQSNDEVDFLRAYAVRSWNEHLRARFKHEAELLLPELERLGAAPFSMELRKKHGQVAYLFKQLHSPHPAAAACLSVLSELLRKHEWFKTKELLPLLEKRLENDTFEQIRAKVVVAQHNAEPTRAAVPA